MKKTVAIIGNGYVGKASAQYFARKFEVVLYDPPQGFEDKDAVNRADLALVCVPTPMGEGGIADLSYIEETFSWLKTPLIIIKSTVPPGTTKMLAERYSLEDALVFSPEFVGEGNYHVPHWKGYPHPTDMSLSEYFIFGGPRSATSKVIPFFTPISGPHTRYMQTDYATAELVKYMDNSYLAMKVTFANEFYDIAKTFGVDYAELRELFTLDGRVDSTHTVVFPDNRGFGGKCLPKDVSGIVEASKKAGYTPSFLGAVLLNNRKFKGEVFSISQFGILKG